MNANDLFLNAIDHWRDNKGVGTALIPPPLEDKVMLLGVLQKIYNKTPNSISLIIVNTFTERAELIEYFTNQEDKNNNEEFKQLIVNRNIKIFTNNFIKDSKYNVKPDLIVLYHSKTIENNIFDLLSKTKFRLVILNSIKLPSNDINKLYSVCPLLSDFEQNEIDEIRTSTPVEERRIGIDITDDEDIRLLTYYNEYITTSIAIFGSFDNIEYGRVGNKLFNLSATQFCYNLALENGWNEKLDMSIEINRQIDAVYNPNNIHERALQTYEIIRKRNTFIANYKDKLEIINKIVKENDNKHILIISKFSEFSAKITKFLNDMSESDICGDYHDRVEAIPASTLSGEPIYVKSGKHKGERRMIAAQAQKSFNEERFNLGYLNVLSTNNSPDKSLSIPIDVIIITSPLCEDIESYIYRLSNVNYPNGTIKLYTLYVRNSVEDKKLNYKRLSETHILTNEIEKNTIDEKNLNFIVSD